MPSRRPPAQRPPPRPAGARDRRNDTMEVQTDWLIESEPPPSKRGAKRTARPPAGKPGPGASIAPRKPTMPRITNAPERRNTMEVDMRWLEFEDDPPAAPAPSGTPARRHRKPWEPPTLPPPPANAARARRVIPPPLPREDDDVPAPKRPSARPTKPAPRGKSTRPPKRR